MTNKIGALRKELVMLNLKFAVAPPAQRREIQQLIGDVNKTRAAERSALIKAQQGLNTCRLAHGAQTGVDEP